MDRLRKLEMVQGKNWTHCMEETVKVYNMTYLDIIRAIPLQLWSKTVEERREALKNTEVRRIQGKPMKISRCSFKPRM